jgi:hypothetical protein
VTTSPDISEEADRLLSLARSRQLPLRLLGGLAVQRHTRPEVTSMLGRSTADIDLATPRGRGYEAAELLSGEGYAPDEALNALNGRRRLLFYDDVNARKVDVFIGRFEMCHSIPVTDRLDVERDTIPVAELLLTKLQIVELNEKDLRDMLALLVSNPIVEEDEGINVLIIAQVLSHDWGLWRTTAQNLDRIRARLADYRLTAADEQRVREACDALWTAIEAEPKSRSWRLRARIGDRKRWYETPEEVG